MCLWQCFFLLTYTNTYTFSFCHNYHKFCHIFLEFCHIFVEFCHIFLQKVLSAACWPMWNVRLAPISIGKWQPWVKLKLRQYPRHPVFDNFADVFNVWVLHLKIDFSFTCNKLCFIIGNAMFAICLCSDWLVFILWNQKVHILYCKSHASDYISYVSFALVTFAPT